MPVAAGDDVTVTRENMRFDEFQFAFVAYRRINHDKQRITEGFQFRSAVLLKGIFDGQFVEVELALQIADLLRIRLFKADPDEMTGFFSPVATLVQRDIADFFASVVHRGSNNSPHSSNRFFFKGLGHEDAA